MPAALRTLDVSATPLSVYFTTLWSRGAVLLLAHRVISSFSCPVTPKTRQLRRPPAILAGISRTSHGPYRARSVYPCPSPPITQQSSTASIYAQKDTSSTMKCLPKTRQPRPRANHRRRPPRPPPREIPAAIDIYGSWCVHRAAKRRAETPWPAASYICVHPRVGRRAAPGTRNS